MRYLALNVSGDQHWGYVDVCTTLTSLDEVILFGSSTEFEDVENEAEIDFVKFQDMATYFSHDEIEKYLDEAAIRHLEVARRDFHALFEMHEKGLSSGTLWAPPIIELRHLLLDGTLDSSDWAWGR